MITHAHRNGTPCSGAVIDSGLHSAKIALYSVDFHDTERMQSAGDWTAAGALLADAARRVEAAGADFLVLCTNTMHKVAPAIERRRDDLGLVQLRARRSMIDLVQVGGKLGRAGGAAPGREARNLDHFCARAVSASGSEGSAMTKNSEDASSRMARKT